MSDAPVTLAYEPRAHQRDAHEKRKRFSVLVWHRGAGKTVFSIYELILAGLRGGPGSRWAYIGPYLSQAKVVAWDYLQTFTRPIPGCVYNQAELTCLLPNGATIRILGANHPDSLRGIHFDGVVLDEVADMDPAVWGSILRPALGVHGGWALFIGTPKGVNLFSEVYFAALKDPTWHADMRRASETGVISAAELVDARRTMSEAQYAQEMDCDFHASATNTLIQLPLVLAAQERNPRQQEWDYAPKVMGVDVAYEGDDSSVICKRQGLVCFQMQEIRGVDPVDLAGRVALVADKWKADAIFVDQTGIGAGTVARLLQLGYRQTIGVNNGGKSPNPKEQNMGAHQWWEMAAWVKTGSLPVDTRLAHDLTARQYTYSNKVGRLELESKRAMKKRGLKSPDFADALALTFAEPVQSHRKDGRPEKYASTVGPYVPPWERASA